tara:strand:+ start:67 stop:1485 length:1419 start_codon:yes stop_codon:yes gene_type:complete
MSKIEVNKIGPQCGTTLTVGCGAGQTVAVDANTVTIGRCGGTVALASGASQTGFGREGSVDWQTGSIKTTTFTAVSGEGYFVDTSSGAVTANLPAGTAGAIVAFADYTRTFEDNGLTISPNGSNKIGGINADAALSVNGQSATFVFVDATEGWINVQETQTSQTGANPYVVATGGTITTSGDYKIHTFTGPGTFCVSAAGTPSGYNKLDYLVVAGGGGSGGNLYHIQGGGGGGAGGFRESKNPAIAPAWTASPLVTCASLTASVGPISVQVGGGGTGGKAVPNPTYPPWPGVAGTSGSDSVFSTITSTGGGRGSQTIGGPQPGTGSGAAQNGGSGGGESGGNPGSGFGTGNTPSVSPPQGNNGGSGDTVNYTLGGSGGGATGVGQNAPPNCTGVDGGTGATTSINASPVTYSTGGNGSKPAPTGAAGNAANNTGNGGPANNYYPGPSGGTIPKYDGFNGGSGIVIIRYKFQN